MRTPSWGDEEESTRQLSVEELRVARLHCASDMPPEPVVDLGDLVEDVDEEDDPSEREFFAREVRYEAEPTSSETPTVPPRRARRSEVPAIFRVEVLREGYWKRRLRALTLLALGVAALAADTPKEARASGAAAAAAVGVELVAR